jgi:hypothetical protein
MNIEQCQFLRLNFLIVALPFFWCCIVYTNYLINKQYIFISFTIYFQLLVNYICFNKNKILNLDIFYLFAKLNVVVEIDCLFFFLNVKLHVLNSRKMNRKNL